MQNPHTPTRSPGHIQALALLTAAFAASAVSSPEAVRVPFCSRHVSVNGELSDWSGAAVLHFAASEIRGPRDNSATVMLQWDTDKLYVAFEVRDTELNGSRVADDENLWYDDAVEVFVDTRNDASADIEMLPEDEFTRRGGEIWRGELVYLQDDDYHVIVNLRATVTTLRGKDLDFQNTGWDADIPYAVVYRGTLNDNSDVDSGYAVEMAIPWEAIGVKAKSGLVLGADFCVGDVDTVGVTKHDDPRYGFDWVASPFFNQPHNWGHIVLEGGPRTGFNAWMTTVGAVLAAMLLTGALVAFRRQRSGRPTPEETAKLSRFVPLLDKLDIFLERNYSRADLSTADAARSLSISERHLQKVLRRDRGRTFRELLAAARVEKAAELLSRSDDRSVSEIGYAVGFTRPDVFSATFKKLKGVSPSDFRHTNTTT